MDIKELLHLYTSDSFSQVLAQQLAAIQGKEPQHFHAKGLVGSLDSLLVATTAQLLKVPHLCILNDKEEAAYFYNDLQSLLSDEQVLFFPMSYRKPYQYHEVDNANVLLRAEVLNFLSTADISGKTLVTVTYPEALAEKVINKKSLIANTLPIQLGNKLDIDFLTEFLIGYDFEKTDFVYEAGQFAVRGGIVDVFSFAQEFPCRIELFGNEVESLRYFNPESQLSVEAIQRISIIPDIQNKLMKETRESFFSFLPKNSCIWLKDAEFSLELIEKSFEKAEASLQETLQRSGGIQVVSNPEILFESRRGFLNQIKGFSTIEFGKRSYFKTENKISFIAKSQPSFNKDFKRLIETLHANQADGFVNIIVAESAKQLDRLRTIFEEIDPFVKFRALQLSLREGFVDQQAKVVCYTDHQIFDRYHKYRIRDKFSKTKALTLKELKTLQAGDYVTHIDYGIGRFAGLEKRTSEDGRDQESIRLIYRDDDVLLVSIHALHKIAKYSGKDGTKPQMNKLGSQDWDNKKKRVKKEVKDIAKELIALYAKRKMAPGYAYARDGYLQAELESSFLYEDTPDQAKATNDVKADMERPHPMDRLICGDVGFGKTEVAIRAAFKACADSKQVAVLVPTTVLAMQHYRTFSERLEQLPVRVEYINRFKSDKEIKQTLVDLKLGKVDILIGTHKIVSKDIVFKNLGLLIIDEEQKFGVKVKDRLKEMRINVDVLTLTATPIPRTLHFSLMGARDLSIIATPPPNRQPVTTELHVFDESFIRDAISYEMQRNGQVFFVHNRVQDIDSIANIILRLVPDAKIGVAHGQMDGDKLEKVMMGFIDNKYDVLISTNIIESGLDIPNANTIIINHAQNFGLSDLHQMRGRVGRSNRKSFCYLLTSALSLLSSDARKRLQALEEFSELGDGFKVAMRDLDIRGAGNLLGAEQSGFISDLGFEMYHKLLDEAVQELKENEFKDLFMGELTQLAKETLPDCLIETDLQILIPEYYVSNISERLSLYAQLDNIENEEQLQAFSQSIADRFGSPPIEVQDTIEIVRIRWQAEQIGFEKLSLKNNTMRGSFVPSDNEQYFASEKFGKVLDYVKQHSKQCQLRDFKGKLVLIIEKMDSIETLKMTLSDILR